MANVIGKIPEFTADDGAPTNKQDAGRDQLGEQGQEEVKKVVADKASKPEKAAETPETPSELPTEEKPLEPETAKEDISTQVQELQRALQGLHNEKEKLQQQITELRGQRRELKQEELLKVQEKIQEKMDELEGVNPEDVNLIEKVLRAKGYVRKEEMHKSFYESVKTDALSKFLEKYPEYKPENDPNDNNWSRFQRELSYYRMPEDPHKITEVLERAHRASVPTTTASIDRTASTKKRQIEVASVGAGGAQRSSSSKPLDSEKKMMLMQGGFTKEDIERIEKGLS